MAQRHKPDRLITKGDCIMICDKKTYKEYLSEDKKALKRKDPFPMPWDYVWRFQRILRKSEYYANCKRGPLGKIIGIFLKMRVRCFGVKCGFSIPENVFGKGLSIAHTGTIVVNPDVKVGDYCRLHVGVNIGTAAGDTPRCPTIGSRVYIGPGVKIFGEIQIADGVAIGANAVVNRSCLTPNVTIAGIPAKVISEKGSEGLLYAGEWN